MNACYNGKKVPGPYSGDVEKKFDFASMSTWAVDDAWQRYVQCS